MTVNDILGNIKSQEIYITNSLYLKSSDNYGCVYKYLKKSRNPLYAERVELFIELNQEESELDLKDKTAINCIEVYPPL